MQPMLGLTTAALVIAHKRVNGAVFLAAYGSGSGWRLSARAIIAVHHNNTVDY